MPVKRNRQLSEETSELDKREQLVTQLDTYLATVAQLNDLALAFFDSLNDMRSDLRKIQAGLGMMPLERKMHDLIEAAITADSGFEFDCLDTEIWEMHEALDSTSDAIEGARIALTNAEDE